ncbi:hypothetical protein PPYR_14625 [Photinus pyralis]|uniref:Uncharacterized protein n=1 Tax=Photinus pyralis TaxID=7054 RepID=A0A1Y1M7G7_PHOPY|nr:hypothetical protein PPYR_14625 [Photinus pyralis]
MDVVTCAGATNNRRNATLSRRITIGLSSRVFWFISLATIYTCRSSEFVGKTDLIRVKRNFLLIPKIPGFLSMLQTGLRNEGRSQRAKNLVLNGGGERVAP